MKAARLCGGLGNQTYLCAAPIFVVREGTSISNEGFLLMEGVQAFQKVGANDAERMILRIHFLKGKLPFRIGGNEGFPVGIQWSEGGVCADISCRKAGVGSVGCKEWCAKFDVV